MLTVYYSYDRQLSACLVTEKVIKDRGYISLAISFNEIVLEKKAIKVWRREEKEGDKLAETQKDIFIGRKTLGDQLHQSVQTEDS